MIRDFEELNEEQIELLSEMVKNKLLLRGRYEVVKGDGMYKKLVKGKLIQNGVSYIDVYWYATGTTAKRVILKSARKKFLEFVATEEQYDKLLGVI